MIYLDYNATTPVLPEVRDAMWPYLSEHWGNPSSAYSFGARSEAAIAAAREQVACVVRANASEIVFTSGATEANNTALHSAVMSSPQKRHLITSETEHSSVLSYCQWLQRCGHEVTYLPVDSRGLIEPPAVEAAIRPDTAMVSLMWANNETGVLLPVAEIAEICRRKGVLYHCDAVQAVGKLPADFPSIGCDYLTLSGHKLGAPKGTGALVVKRSAPFEPLIRGGKQEQGRRGGTESVPLIVGFGKACEIATRNQSETWRPIAALRDYLETRLYSEFVGAYRNGTPDRRLPNTLCFGVRGVDSDGVVAFLDRHDLCISSGSACLEQALAPSHVVLAMTHDYQRANEAIRVSLGLNTTQVELDRFVDLLRQFVATAG